MVCEEGVSNTKECNKAYWKIVKTFKKQKVSKQKSSEHIHTFPQNKASFQNKLYQKQSSFPKSQTNIENQFQQHNAQNHGNGNFV